MIKAFISALALLLAAAGGALAQGLPTPTSSWCVDNSSNPPFWKLCSQLAIAGGTRVELSPTTKMVDTFNNTASQGLDVQGIWKAVVQPGGGNSTYVQGQQLLTSGTTAGGYALLQTKQQYQINSPSFILYRSAINFQFPESTTNCKEMGFFSVPAGTPTCAAPVQEGILFEVTSTTTQGNPGGGKLQAVTYAGGVRQLIADLSVQAPGVTFPAIADPTPGATAPLCPSRQTPQPIDTCPHILDIWFNGNSAEFDVDFQPVAFMKSGKLGQNNNGTPWSALTINTSGGAASTIPINQAAVGDEGRNEVRQLPYFYTNITAAAPTTTNIKYSSGILHSICINTAAAAAGTLTIYDDVVATGTSKIGTITQLATGQVPVCFTYDVLFTNGLTILTATSAADYTVSWR